MEVGIANVGIVYTRAHIPKFGNLFESTIRARGIQGLLLADLYLEKKGVYIMKSSRFHSRLEEMSKC